MKVSLLSILYIYLLEVSYGLDPFETQPAGIVQHWTRFERADPHSMINLTIALSNPNDAAFEERAMKIATPFSGFYRKHLEAAELAEWVKPREDSLQQVQGWLSKHGIESVQNHELLEVTVSIHKAEDLLNTAYYTYRNKAGRVVPRVEQYFVPENLESLIEFIHPTVNFPHSKRNVRLEPVSGEDLDRERLRQRDIGISRKHADPCSNKIFTSTPACVYSVYNVTYIPPDGMGITVENFLSFGTQINATDLQTFLEHYNKPAAQAHPRVDTHRVSGPKYPPQNGNIVGLSEQDLDLQMIVGYGWPLQSSYTYENDEAGYFKWGPFSPLKTPPPQKLHHYEQEYLHYLHSLAHQQFVPATWTTSEYDLEVWLTQRYSRFICKKFGQISARGVTMFTASGDLGSTGQRLKNGKIKLSPSYPNGCTFITNVGGTVYDNGTEKACTSANRRAQGKRFLSSGGGFSLYFDIPKFQQDVVLAYVKKYDIEKKFGDAISWNLGRAWPDISLPAAKIPAVANGSLVVGGGTSASSPIAAALFGFLNAYEKSKGRPPLGFINPWLYMHPEMFHDFAHGAPSVVYPLPRYKGLGFPQAPGWDAVTGLGSPNFKLLLKSLDDMADAGALD